MVQIVNSFIHMCCLGRSHRVLVLRKYLQSKRNIYINIETRRIIKIMFRPKSKSCQYKLDGVAPLETDPPLQHNIWKEHIGFNKGLQPSLTSNITIWAHISDVAKVECGLNQALYNICFINIMFNQQPTMHCYTSEQKQSWYLTTCHYKSLHPHRYVLSPLLWESERH